MFPQIFSSKGGRYLSGDSFLRRPARRPGSSLLRDLAAHWRLDEASGTRYDSVSSHHLSPHGSVQRADGIVGGYAAQFVPFTGDYLSAPGSPDLRMAGTDFTLAGWVFFNSLGQAGLAGKWDTGSLEYLAGCDGTYLNFSVSSDGSTVATVTAETEMDTGVWVYFMAWYDSVAGGLQMTVNDGSIFSQSYSSGVFAGGADLELGREHAGNTSLSGRLDSVSLWKRCLTAGERSRLYNEGAGLDYPF